MATHKHIFENICINFEEILQEPNIRKMLKAVQNQAKTEEAKKRTDLTHYKDYGEDEWSPIYFGLFVEWFAEHFLNHFGHLFNVTNVKMNNAEGSAIEDLGVDGVGMTMNKKKHPVAGSIVSQPGNAVYIQVKGTLNFNKEHKANDGSRLPNFATHAMSTAIKNGTAYQTRYILFTTAKGVHYVLEKMWNGLVEVIAIEQIIKLANNNQYFLNILRERVGLTPLEFQMPPIDPEAQYHISLEND